MLLQWGQNTKKIAEKIKQNKSFLKIVLKTYNDAFFLERWIDHHAKIVGMENLIIADNMSTDEDVLSIYEKYKQTLLVFQFSVGHHNRIHDRKSFNLLYNAFRLSCEYTLFIDTDEFLVLFDNNRWYADDFVVKRLQLIDSKGAIPCAWLHNSPHSDKEFYIGASNDQLVGNLKWGKPIVPSQFIGEGWLIHNEQFPKFNFWVTKGTTNFFLLHLTKLSSEQRIKVNINKLAKRGFCTSDDTIDSIIKKDWTNCHDPAAIRFIHEIQDCIKNQYKHQNQKGNTISSNCLKLLPNGEIAYASAAEQSILDAFLDKPELNICLALNLSAEGGLKMLNEGISFRNQGNFVSAENTFKTGLIEYPNQLDQYGHPIFKKELMRTLLSQQKWDEANKLIPNKNDIGGSDWHKILFARAYSQINDITNAKLWWTAVIEYTPNNAEAKHFFSELTDNKTPTPKRIRILDIQDISSRPFMEEQGILLLEEHLKKAETFLEYGAGGSTIFAAELGVKNIHSVESDKAFLDAVQKKAASTYPNAKIHAHFVNIGKTKEWGHPANKDHADSWPKYCSAPWQFMLENDQLPNLILIDGRFRVACFLTCLLLAKSGTIILFDDYVDRSHYHIVEKYLRPNKTAGRMAEFIIEPNSSVSLVLLDLITYITNPA